MSFYSKNPKRLTLSKVTWYGLQDTWNSKNSSNAIIRQTFNEKNMRPRNGHSLFYCSTKYQIVTFCSFHSCSNAIIDTV